MNSSGGQSASANSVTRDLSKSGSHSLQRVAFRGPAAFLRDERGGVSIFMLVLFILLLVVGGMAVDYQRHEAARADLQDALDRGSLAAANLNQTYIASGTKTTDQQAQDVINEYMASRNFKLDAFTLNASVTDIAGGREVAANASLEIQTIFLSLIGIDTLSVNATSKATHAASWLEIMLVLDITGSMERNSQSGLRKIDDLKIAAKQFIDTVLAAGSGARTTISILPFSQNVNLPRPVADLFDIDRQHDYASCIDYSEFDFTTTAIPLDKGTPYKQMQHFDSDVGSGMGRYACPTPNNAATLYSNNAGDLKAAIDAMTPETWTAMYMGTRMAAAMLDPAAAGIVTDRIANAGLSATFAGSPRPWNDTSVRKIIVLMSDGQNTRLNRIGDTDYAAQPVTWWNANQVPSGQRVRVIDNDNDGGVGDAKLKQICDTIKASPNAIIYTIGFEVTGIQSAQAALSDCASDLTTYYLVEGVDISTAFQNIADEITNLKLAN